MITREDLKPEGYPKTGSPGLAAFTLVEMLVVITIIGILLAVGMPMLTDPTNSARRAAGDVLRAHLQEARAHAIATGTTTSLLFPEYGASDKLGGALMGIAEVEAQANTSSPYKVTKLLQRWTPLPETIFFLDKNTCKSKRNTIMDTSEMIEAEYQKKKVNCHYVVFSPNGQIISPQSDPGKSALAIALGKGVLKSGSVRPTQNNQSGPVFDFLQINRLSARARMVSPDSL